MTRSPRLLVLVLTALACRPEGSDTTADSDATDPIWAQLVAVDDLPEGDPACEHGGVRVRTGFDDGSGDGGVAGDGTLQDGEVTNTSVVCDGAPAPLPTDDDPYLSLDPPDGADGDGLISAMGGASDDARGGDGGTVSLAAAPGSRYGHVKVFRTGRADVSFQVPAVDVEHGTEPLVVDGTLVVPTTDAPAEPGVYLRPGSSGLWRWNGAAWTALTGLHVRAGAVLELTPNLGYGTGVDFTDGVLVEGELTAQDGADGWPDLTVRARSFVLAPGGSVNVAGQTRQDRAGGDGGSLRIETTAPHGWRNGQVGSIVLEGTVAAGGGSGTLAGSGGTVRLVAGTSIWMTGTIDATGGDAAASFAPRGGEVSLVAGQASVFARGTIDVDAGTGPQAAPAFADSGRGGTVDVFGPVVVLGAAVEARGASTPQTACVDACPGGSGGAIAVSATARLSLDATLDVSGGDGTVPLRTARGRPSGTGGHGGAILLSLGTSGLRPPRGAEAPSREVRVELPALEVSGRFLLDGGTGAANGGNGGTFRALLGVTNALRPELRLLGVAQLAASGGDGPSGGNGGVVELRQEPSSDGERAGPTGGVLNHADVLLRGGDGSADGGAGGILDAWANAAFPADHLSGQVALNHGDLDVSGGAGVLRAGDAGAVYIVGATRAENHGDITGNGGEGPNTGGAAAAPALLLEAEGGTVAQTGVVTAVGGAGDDAGDGGAVWLYGSTGATTAGSYLLDGGDGAEAGRGGTLTCTVPFGATDWQATSASVDGGTGDAPGARGSIVVDGFDRTTDLAD